MGPELDIQLLLEGLRDDLGRRRIEQGFRSLENALPVIDSLGPGRRDAGTLAGLVAQWVDAGFHGPELLRRLLASFPAESRSELPLLDYLHLRMAEGALAMSEEDYDRAAGHFRLVQSLENDIGDRELLAIASFWTGRCLRREGRYDDALDYIEKGEALALACGYTEMAAIMQMSRSWLAFQKNRLTEATAILRKAEEALSRTDDHLSRGNVQSAHGRIARRQGRYEQALEYFERAIAEYRRGGGGHLQLARALLNIAFVKRLIALQLQKALDTRAASRRTTAGAPPPPNDLTREQRARIERMRDEARAELQESFVIYERSHYHRGIAGVHINTGFLCLDSGDLEGAAALAAEAFRHGEEKHDHIVMARARTLQCMVENARIEEQIGDPVRLFENAIAHAREAVAYAEETQNRRLLARAYVWQGLTLASSPHGNQDEARNCAERATSLLKPEGTQREYVWEDLEALRAAVVRAGPVDATLRAWTAGIVGEKSFQEISEEFARIVIPKVWEREGRKVSRVAARLAISPKKVRRILRAAGLEEPKPEPEESEADADPE